MQINYENLKAIIEIKPSTFLPGEVGLFAVRDLIKRTIVGDAVLMQDNLMKWDDFNKIDKLSRKIIKKFCCATRDGIYVPENINYLPIPWFNNHSCNPNLGFDENDNVITINKVVGGEELCLDFAFVISYPNYLMHCKCNSINCREIITGNDWKSPQFKNKRKYMISYLRELF